MARTYEIAPAMRDPAHPAALIIGIVAPSGAGKTLTGLRLAEGIKSVYGGKVGGIDTEAGRMLQYAPNRGQKANPPHTFDFDVLHMGPPFSSRDFMGAIDALVAKGCNIIFIDGMEKEHTGEGGRLSQSEAYIDDKMRQNPQSKRQAWAASSWIEPSRQRRELNNHIMQLARDVVFIFAYQASEKIDFSAKNERGYTSPQSTGYQAETTSSLKRQMVIQFLLPECGNGCPVLRPEAPEEKKAVKIGWEFEPWFSADKPIDESIGRKLALWARAEDSESESAPVNHQPAAAVSSEFAGWGLLEFIEYLEAAGTMAELAERFNQGKAAIKDPVELADFVRRKDVMKSALKSKPEYADDAVPFNPK